MCKDGCGRRRFSCLDAAVGICGIVGGEESKQKVSMKGGQDNAAERWKWTAARWRSGRWKDGWSLCGRPWWRVRMPQMRPKNGPYSRTALQSAEMSRLWRNHGAGLTRTGKRKEEDDHAKRRWDRTSRFRTDDGKRRRVLRGLPVCRFCKSPLRKRIWSGVGSRRRPRPAEPVVRIRYDGVATGGCAMAPVSDTLVTQILTRKENGYA